MEDELRIPYTPAGQVTDWMSLHHWQIVNVSRGVESSGASFSLVSLAYKTAAHENYKKKSIIFLTSTFVPKSLLKVKSYLTPERIYSRGPPADSLDEFQTKMVVMLIPEVKKESFCES